MAAVLHPRPSGPRAAPPSRPSLRLIAGGRSPQALAVTFRRRRLVALVLVALVLTGALVAVRAAAGALAPAGPAPVAAPVGAAGAGGGVYVVQPGDTLWSVAGRLPGDGDLRPVVDRLAAAHRGGPLLPGDRIDLAAVRAG